jgi:hypothetical protein
VASARGGGGRGSRSFADAGSSGGSVHWDGAVALSLMTFYNGSEMKEWGDQTWGFAKQIMPRYCWAVSWPPGFFLVVRTAVDAGIIPNRWIQALVGDNPSVFWGDPARQRGDSPSHG